MSAKIRESMFFFHQVILNWVKKMFTKDDDGACRYFGTLYGVFAILKEKGLVKSEDMNTFIGYADLATKTIKDIVKSVKVADPLYLDFGRIFPISLKERESSLDSIKSGLVVLESMAGPTAIMTKLRSELEDKLHQYKLTELEKRRSKFKILDGGPKDESSDLPGHAADGKTDSDGAGDNSE